MKIIKMEINSISLNKLLETLNIYGKLVLETDKSNGDQK